MRPLSLVDVNITWSKRWIKSLVSCLFTSINAAFGIGSSIQTTEFWPPTDVNPSILPPTGMGSINSLLHSNSITVSFVRAEGAATVVIKPLEAALADNDHIYAVVRNRLLSSSPFLIAPAAGPGHRRQQQWV